MFKIGQVFDGVYPPQAAVWCNANGAHIEMQGGVYVIVANAPAPEPPLEEQVARLEMQYDMNRWQREGILAAPDKYAALTVQRAREIEALAAPLREGDAV